VIGGEINLCCETNCVRMTTVLAVGRFNLITTVILSVRLFNCMDRHIAMGMLITNIGAAFKTKKENPKDQSKCNEFRHIAFNLGEQARCVNE